MESLRNCCGAATLAGLQSQNDLGYKCLKYHLVSTPCHLPLDQVAIQTTYGHCVWVISTALMAPRPAAMSAWSWSWLLGLSGQPNPSLGKGPGLSPPWKVQPGMLGASQRASPRVVPWDRQPWVFVSNRAASTSSTQNWERRGRRKRRAGARPWVRSLSRTTRDKSQLWRLLLSLVPGCCSDLSLFSVLVLSLLCSCPQEEWHEIRELEYFF